MLRMSNGEAPLHSAQNVFLYRLPPQQVREGSWPLHCDWYSPARIPPFPLQVAIGASGSAVGVAEVVVPMTCGVRRHKEKMSSKWNAR